MGKYEELEKIIGKEKIKYNVCMKNYTTLKIGGNVECFVMPTSILDIVNTIEYAKNNNIKYYVIGNGSNLLVCDEDIEGIIIRIGSGMSEVKVDGTKIEAMAGATIPKVSIIAKNNSLEGMEFCSGIPGTVGGAIRMNAGAYGSQMDNIVEKITYLDENMNILTMTNSQAKFSYRHSVFCENHKLIVLGVVFNLKKGSKDEIAKKMKENNLSRIEKQPLDMPNAGSTFKRVEGFYVGKLIEDAGLKGYSVGDMQVSTKHAGFIVNKGNGTCKDMKKLINHIQEVIYEKYNVKLELEIEIIEGENK